MSGEAPISVSVAIWTCNQEQFIGEAIESALDQDYPGVEIVVADDNSDDSSSEIVTEYARRYPDRVSALLNRGPRSIVANVNRALAACTGELVATLDGDDFFLPGKVSALAKAFAEHPDVAVCRHPVQVVDERGTVVDTVDLLPSLRLAGPRDLLVNGFFIYTAGAMMLRRSAMPRGGVPELAEHAPDSLLAIETARRGPILRVDGILASYRRHASQITAPEPGSEVVFEDAMRGVAYVEATYPELADACPRARVLLTRWEADRRRVSSDLDWVSAGVRRALRAAPLDRSLWQTYATVSAKRLSRRLKAR
jgi:glycosyltransferase involved in cell wall biosynthesis